MLAGHASACHSFGPWCSLGRKWLLAYSNSYYGRTQKTRSENNLKPSHSLRRARISEGKGRRGAAWLIDPRSVSTEVKFWSWGLAVELDDEFDDELSTRYLIKRQRKLGESPLLIDRLTAMILGSALGDRLNELSDRQIGQLLFGFCWPELYVDGPELIIVTQAIDRLRRSTG